MYDQDIIRKVIAGDVDAFAKMYSDYAPAAYRQAYEAVQDYAKAREAVRETFIDIFRYCAQLSDTTLFDEWVFRLVNFHCGKIKQAGAFLDKPDLQIVWDEIEQTIALNDAHSGYSAEQSTEDPGGQASTVHAEAAAIVQQAQTKNEMDTGYYAVTGQKEDVLPEEPWNPILFPPEDGVDDDMPFELSGYAWDAALRTPSSHSPGIMRETWTADQPEADGQRPEPQETADAAPEPDTNEPMTRITYQSVHVAHGYVSPRVSYERVPYEYIPYEDTTQAVYDRISIDEAPKGVYEKIPYRRDEPEQSQAADVEIASAAPAEGSRGGGMQDNGPPADGREEPIIAETADAAAVEDASFTDAEDVPESVYVSSRAMPDAVEPEQQDMMESGMPDIQNETGELPEEHVLQIVNQQDVDPLPPRSKKRFTAGTGFFIAALVLIALAVGFGFWWGVLS